MQNNFSLEEGIFLIIKQYFTNNIFYYFLCVIFRFIPMILIYCNNSSIFEKYNNSKFILKILKALTLYNIINYLNFSYKMFCAINILLYFIYIIKFILFMKIKKKMKNYKFTHKWPLPNKYEIIINHIRFLFFPYLLEFFSFSYYIFFLPNKFIIKNNNNEKSVLIIIMILNTLLIFHINSRNHNYLICSNKIFTTSIFDAYSKTNNKKIFKYKKPFSYRCKNFILFIYEFLQNFALFQHIEIYLVNIKYKIIIKIIFSFILLLIFIILFFCRINEYKHINFITSLINIIILFCFYSMIFDFILSINKCQINNIFLKIIYLLIKISIIKYIK